MSNWGKDRNDSDEEVLDWQPRRVNAMRRSGAAAPRGPAPRRMVHYDTSDEESAAEDAICNTFESPSYSKDAVSIQRDDKSRRYLPKNDCNRRTRGDGSPKETHMQFRGKAKKAVTSFKPRSLPPEDRSSTLRETAMRAKASNAWAEVRPNRVYESDEDKANNYAPCRSQGGSRQAWNDAKPQTRDLHDYEREREREYSPLKRSTTEGRAKGQEEDASVRCSDDEGLDGRRVQSPKLRSNRKYNVSDDRAEGEWVHPSGPQYRSGDTLARNGNDIFKRKNIGNSARRSYEGDNFEVEEDQSDDEYKETGKKQGAKPVECKPENSRGYLMQPAMATAMEKNSKRSGAKTKARNAEPQADFELEDNNEHVDEEGYIPSATVLNQNDVENSHETEEVLPFVHRAPASGPQTNKVQCTVIRNRSSVQNKLKPIYELYLDDGNRKIITAIKQSLNRTSNYHFFDRTRGQLGSKLSKKNGNYLGKLRAKTSSRTDYVLVTHNSDREEIAGIQFEKHGLFHQLKDGSQPRKMTVILPHLGKHRVPIPNALGNNDAGSMIDMLRDGTGGNRILSFESKDPVFDGGNYRLNFDGRVSMPSVKNFQLVPRNDIDNIALQFGKVGEDTFHLDFKSPLTAFQAFALAICQFNL